MSESESESESRSLAEALPAEIKRVQAKKELWVKYQADADRNGERVMFGPAIMMMQMEIDEGLNALASGNVVRMLAAYQALKENSDD